MPKTLSKSEQKRLAEQQRGTQPVNNTPEANVPQGVVGPVNPDAHPDDARELPKVEKRNEGPEGQKAQGEEIPGQPAAAQKNRIPVPSVSHIGEKTR